MSLQRESDRLDLERDLPTTAADVEALRRAREAQALPTDAYLLFLNRFSSHQVSSSRPILASAEPFRL